jgi:hypothetical protein
MAGELQAAIRQAFRDFTTDGVPASGPYQPAKSQIRAALLAVANQVDAQTLINITGALPYGTRAELFADLAHPAGTYALVIADSNTAYRGFYQKSGASGAGSWALTLAYDAGSVVTRVTDLETRETAVEGRATTLEGQTAALAAADTAEASTRAAADTAEISARTTAVSNEATARAAADALLAPLSSPHLTGEGTSPTPPHDEDSTRFATMANISNAVARAAAIAANVRPLGRPATAIADASQITLPGGQVISPFEAALVWMFGSSAFRAEAHPVNFGAVAALAAAATLYYGVGRSSSTIGRAIWVADRAGVLRNLYAAVDVAPSAGQSTVLTLMKNGVATTITATISGTGTTASDIANEISIAVGDLIELRAVASAGAATANALSATLSLGV